MGTDRQSIIRGMEQEKIIAIVRGYSQDEILRLAEALLKGGIHFLELTFDQKDEAQRLATAEHIRLLINELGADMRFGAGTVTTPEMVELARQAGGRFIVSPDTNEAVIRATREKELVSIPGALTPSEISSAYRFGADLVKVFPANLVGPAYFKTVSAPLSNIPLLAVGGVADKNIGAYLAAGACGAGVAGCLFNKQLIAARDWAVITDNARRLVGAVRGGEPLCS